MNKNTRFERKSTFNTENQYEQIPRVDFRSPHSRLVSKKSLSITQSPFSHHIFGQQAQLQQRADIETVFHSQKWNFEPKTQTQEKNSDVKSCKNESKNPFIQAVRACVQKSKELQPSPKRKMIGDEIEHDLFNEVTSYRAIKRNSINQMLQDCIDTVI